MEGSRRFENLTDLERNTLEREFENTASAKELVQPIEKYTRILRIQRIIAIVLGGLSVVLIAILFGYLPEGWNYAGVVLYLALLAGVLVWAFMVWLKRKKAIKRMEREMERWLKEEKNIIY